MKKRFLVILLFLGSSIQIISAQISHSVRGVALSHYNQEIANVSLDKNYLYRSYTLSIVQKKKIVALPVFALTYDFETQLGMSHVSNQREVTFVEKGIEAALILGLNVEASLLPDYWWIYVGGSIGPQFISLAPSRQAKGFIFSDSVYAGSRFSLGTNRQLDLRAGLLHQSNAGISAPNGGIDSIFVKMGLFIHI